MDESTDKANEGSVADMHVKVGADTKEFVEKIEYAKEKVEELNEALSNLPGAKVNIESDINGNKSS